MDCFDIFITDLVAVIFQLFIFIVIILSQLSSSRILTNTLNDVF